MTPAFTTRSEADAYRGLDPSMVEKMAERAYEAGKQSGSHLPPWPQVNPHYQAARRAEVVAAVSFGIEAGYLAIKGAKG